MDRNRLKLFAGLTAAMVIFGSIGLFRRWIPLPSAALACFRGFSGALFLLAVMRVRKKKQTGPMGRRKALPLALSGALMGFNWILLFEAYRYTTVATATLCYYMQPTFVILLSPLVFRERLTLRKGICAAVSLAGMILVSGVAEAGLPPWGEARGILLGLGAAALYAAVVMINKAVPGVDTYRKTVIQLLSAAVALVPYLLVYGEAMPVEWTPGLIGLLLAVGLVHTGLAYALYFGSMEGLSAQTVAIFSYIDPVTALILSALVLHERMTTGGIVGALLIIGAAVICESGPRTRRGSGA